MIIRVDSRDHADRVVLHARQPIKASVWRQNGVDGIDVPVNEPNSPERRSRDCFASRRSPPARSIRWVLLRRHAKDAEVYIGEELLR